MKLVRRRIFVVAWYWYPPAGAVLQNGYSLHASNKDVMAYLLVHRARAMFQNAADGFEAPLGTGTQHLMWRTDVYDDGTLGGLPKGGEPYGVRIMPDDPLYPAAHRMFSNLPRWVVYGSKTIPFSFKL